MPTYNLRVMRTRKILEYCDYQVVADDEDTAVNQAYANDYPDGPWAPIREDLTVNWIAPPPQSSDEIRWKTVQPSGD